MICRWSAGINKERNGGLMKLIVNAPNDRIPGASILSPEGGELVQIFQAVMTPE
jgi:pyruvate/2-oxoglutarate dehydrogenase complex dihydrolipoamide dehydrogenase (E3) component